MFNNWMQRVDQEIDCTYISRRWVDDRTGPDATHWQDRFAAAKAMDRAGAN
jgi:hypothetical protein